MSESGAALHVHALVWAAVTIVLVLVAEPVFSSIAIASAVGAIIFGVAAVSQKRTTSSVLIVGVLAVVVAAVGGVIAVSRVLAPQFGF